MKNILLIGLGRFGKHVAYQLNELGHEVMAVDENENLVNEILPYVTDAQIGDSTNENFLESLGIKNYDICFDDRRQFPEFPGDNFSFERTWR